MAATLATAHVAVKPLAQLATLGEIAALLNCSEKTVRRQIAAGLLRAYKIGELIRLDRAEVLAAVKAVAVDPAEYGA